MYSICSLKAKKGSSVCDSYETYLRNTINPWLLLPDLNDTLNALWECLTAPLPAADAALPGGKIILVKVS